MGYQPHNSVQRSHVQQGIIKFKAFSCDPQLLQELIENLRLAYGARRCTTSSIQPAKEGDLFIYVQIFEEAA
jgi:hypothetical protein